MKTLFESLKGREFKITFTFRVISIAQHCEYDQMTQVDTQLIDEDWNEKFSDRGPRPAPTSFATHDQSEEEVWETVLEDTRRDMLMHLSAGNREDIKEDPGAADLYLRLTDERNKTEQYREAIESIQHDSHLPDESENCSRCRLDRSVAEVARAQQAMAARRDAHAGLLRTRTTSDRRHNDLDAARIAIAICKQEVEKLVGSTLDMMDGGSVWGRAFFLTLQELKKDVSPAAGKLEELAKSEGPQT